MSLPISACEVKFRFLILGFRAFLRLVSSYLANLVVVSPASWYSGPNRPVSALFSEQTTLIPAFGHYPCDQSYLSVLCLLCSPVL